MTKAVKSRRWFASWRKAARPDGGDPADHGTAFGLEMSLPDTLPLPVALKKEAGRLNRPGWMRRLTPGAKTLA
jgi:hypothetical protein